MIERFRDGIRSAGLEPPDEIEPDGKLHRFASNGKRGDNAGWYVLHRDGIAAGCFGDWRSGIKENWRADIGRPLTPAEESAHRAKVESMRRERVADETRRHAEAATKAAAIWKQAQSAPDDHQYLARKGIKAHGAKLHNGALVIPMRDGAELHSLQFIDADGAKRFLAGGRVVGCYFSIGNPKGAAALCIAEGFATGATIHEATGYPVAVAFNAGNLEPVTRALRANFPEMELILCADDDVKTAGNQGLTKATAAARAVGGKLALPDFGIDRPDGVTDFNDMGVLRGLEAVKQAIMHARTPKETTAGPALDSSSMDNPDPITSVLTASGLSALQSGADMTVVEAAVRALAAALVGADDIRRVMVREAALKKLKEIGISAAGKLIDAAMPSAKSEDREKQGQALVLADPEHWPVVVNLADLLDDIVGLIRRVVVLPLETLHAVVLWILLAWALAAFDISPLLAITSPTKRCGKTTLLEIIGMLTPRSISASNITAAALFRAIEQFGPTLSLDEADTFLGENDELRGVINSGHRRSSAFVIRTVGDEHEARLFSTWCPKVIAAIGKLQGTLEDRSILVSMRRRAPGESVERFRTVARPVATEPLRQKAFRWADDAKIALRNSDPNIPSELNDRAADNWLPLFSIADLAGGEWPARARAAALALSKDSDEADGSALIDLLIELREIFRSRDRITSNDLAAHLGGKPESRFGEWSHGKPITQRQVARLLATLKIKPSSVRVGTETPRGYLREWFDDAFSRYIPLSIRNSATSQPDQIVTSENDPQQKTNVADRNSAVSTRKDGNVADVADRNSDLWERIA